MARLVTLLVASLAVLVVLLAAPAMAGGDATPSEADVKKMKVKQLRQFLDDRGVVCDSCEEKSDWVRLAVKHLKTPIHPSKVKAPLPKKPFWEAWADIAMETCEATAKTKGSGNEATDAKICKALKVATDSFFMQFGKRTATKLKKKPDALLKTSFGDVYQSAGRKMFAKLAGFCLKKGEATCGSSGKVQAMMENDNKVKGVKFNAYITNVGIENTNPMYETMKDKQLLNDEL